MKFVSENFFLLLVVIYNKVIGKIILYLEEML